MICKNCGKTIYLYEDPRGTHFMWLHTETHDTLCRTFATPQDPKPTRQERAQ
jgi:hypothetical protein